MVVLLAQTFSGASVIAADGDNIVLNGDFHEGILGKMPARWTVHSARSGLQPNFMLVEESRQKVLEASGNGNSLCVGYASTQVQVTKGKTYLFEVEFKVSPDINPQENTLFQCFYPGRNDGIFEFSPMPDEWIRGAVKIDYPGTGTGQAQIRILFRFSAAGKIWVRRVSLRPCEPVQPRWVRVVCTQGKTNHKKAAAILDEAGRAGADLVLLPEYLAGDRIEEPLEGPSFKLMSDKARQHKMYVAGGIVQRDDTRDVVYNTALLVNRQGKLAGVYNKIHLYNPEVNEQGISPGNEVPVFDCDFGRIGIMTCYDSWFTDVAELLSLKGAEIILFPNAGYYRCLMPARATDNQVRIVCSTWNNQYGIWDTAGRDVLAPKADDVSRTREGITFKNVEQLEVAGVKLLAASLDLNCSPSPCYNGGTMRSAPGGLRNRRNQVFFLEDEIKRERQRWRCEPSERPE